MVSPYRDTGSGCACDPSSLTVYVVFQISKLYSSPMWNLSLVRHFRSVSNLRIELIPIKLLLLLTLWSLAHINQILDKQFLCSFWWSMVEVSLIKLHSDSYHWASLKKSQHWYRLWLGAVRQQAMIWSKVDWDPCRHSASLSYDESMLLMLYTDYLTRQLLTMYVYQWYLYFHAINVRD